jgi:AhpD family alkylhydroperoxidase
VLGAPNPPSRGAAPLTPRVARTHTLRTLGADIAALVRAGSPLLVIYGSSRVDPTLRERVIVAVSRANACRQCTRVHEAWALRVGVPTDELEQIGAGDLARDPRGATSRDRLCPRVGRGATKSIPPDAQAFTDEHLDPLAPARRRSDRTADQLRQPQRHIGHTVWIMQLASAVRGGPTLLGICTVSRHLDGGAGRLVAFLRSRAHVSALG